MEIPTFDIELILSGKAEKFLRIEPTLPRVAQPLHFLAQWRLELAEDGSGGKWFLMTNATTLYSIVIAREPKMSLEKLADQFSMRLRFILLGATPPIEWRPGTVRPMRGGSPSLIGSMNNMVYLLGERASGDSDNHEEFLNDTPFFSIPEAFPAKAFFGRLNSPPSAEVPIRESKQMQKEAPSAFNSRAILRTLEQQIAADQGNPLEKAQELYYDAMDAATDGQRIRLLHKALEIDPGNVDANLALLNDRAVTPTEEIEWLRKIVMLAGKRLGANAFKELRGGFWTCIETRPYMRARAQLAEALKTAGQTENAITEWAALLQLNPNDNQGIRYRLLPEYLAHHRTADAARLFAQYPECEFSTLFAWARVLERTLVDDLPGAQKALIIARKQNHHTEPFINGRKRLPKKTPVAYGVGTLEEAICFAEPLHYTWKSHPDALEWLSAQR